MLDLGKLAADLAQVTQPVARANGLPNALYTSRDALELEAEKIFKAGWVCIGFGKDVPEPGDAVPVDLLGMPLLLLRDKEGQIRVYENVCRHRGMILVSEARNFGGVIRCPYHSWCYSLDGKLRATPHVGGPGINAHDSIDRDNTGLTPIATGVFMDVVFVNISGTAPTFDDWIAPVRARLADFADRPIFPGATDSSFQLDVACNWKLAVENYCESYHVPWVHPGLAVYSRLEDHYHIEEPGEFSGQGTLVYNPDLKFPQFPDLPSKWDTAAEYVALYPNVLIGVHNDHVFHIRLDPVAHDRTLENVELYYTSEEAASGEAHADKRAKNSRMWEEIFVEDIASVEGMQAGRGAPHFDGGRFSAVMDSPTHCFHDWVARRLGA